MTKVGVFTDPHIRLEDFEELQLVCNETVTIFKTNNVKEIWMLGDSFHRTNPSPLEIDFFSNFLKQFGNIPIKIVAAASHESISLENSILTHFGILKDNILIAPHFEFTINNKKFLLLHRMFKESLCGFKEDKSIYDYNYDFLFAGHQHTPQEIVKNKAYHIGSCRYINFSEAKDPYKYVGILDFDKKEANPLELIELKSIYPMFDLTIGTDTSILSVNGPKIKKRGRPPKRAIEQKSLVSSSQETQNPRHFGALSDLFTFLDSLSPKSKVRLTFEDFNIFADYLKNEENYKKKFYVYKRETKFNVFETVTESSKKDNQSMVEYFKRWLEEKKIKKEIAEILLKELA